MGFIMFGVVQLEMDPDEYFALAMDILSWSRSAGQPPVDPVVAASRMTRQTPDLTDRRASAPVPQLWSSSRATESHEMPSSLRIDASELLTL